MELRAGHPLSHLAEDQHVIVSEIQATSVVPSRTRTVLWSLGLHAFGYRSRLQKGKLGVLQELEPGMVERKREESLRRR